MSDFKLWGSSGTTKDAWQETLILASLHRVIMYVLWGRMISAGDSGTKYRVHGFSASLVWDAWKYSLRGRKSCQIAFSRFWNLTGRWAGAIRTLFSFLFLGRDELILGISRFVIGCWDISLLGTFEVCTYVCSNGLHESWNSINFTLQYNMCGRFLCSFVLWSPPPNYPRKHGSKDAGWSMG